MALLVNDLVWIGMTGGLDVAERVYRELREEPRTAHGDRIDWVVIVAHIRQAQREARHAVVA